MLAYINRMQSWQKTLVAMAHDFIMSIICFYLSIAIRLGSATLQSTIEHSPFFKSMITVGITQFATFYVFGLYRGMWRYSSTHDLTRVIKGVLAAVVVSYITLFLFFRLSGIPRSAIAIDVFLLILTLGGGRFAYRILRDHDYQTHRKSNAKRILIIGAGHAGDALFREIRNNIFLNFDVLGFVDDDKTKKNKLLHGVKVLGGAELLPDLIPRLEVDEIFIAMPTATGKQINRIIQICSKSEVQIKTLPKMSDVINGHIEVSQLRNVKIEDILGRKEIHLDQDSINSIICDRRVLISGAGGSIGSELVIQILKFRPKELILVDISEINLFNLERRIKETEHKCAFKCIIADVRDRSGMDRVFSKHRPEIVLHAAAYKHVPLMEKNPTQAIRTNIYGTMIMGEMATKHKAANFVLVSTDKAVNPTNIMGTSKRVAEIVIQNYQRLFPDTHFTTVRFGNVLGSSGSVIPVFKEQIKRGGPITVTHPDIQRYFMSIPEAAQLILQAATLGNGGELFVLDMGEPIKILDLAKQLIKLANLEEGKDIEIQITGLRPGEKLFEELLADKETTLPTSHPLVRTAKSIVPEAETIQKVRELLAIENVSPEEIKKRLLDIVPEYDPQQNQNQIFVSKGPNPSQVH